MKCQKNHLNFIEKGRPDSVWAGASDRETEGNWFWDNGEAVNMDEAAWAHNQPNNHKLEEDCAISYRSTGQNYAMNDQSCSKGKPFICQID